MNEEQKKTITITKEEYEELLDDSQLLDALREAGVDNWDGYDEAMEMLDEWNNESEG